MVKVVKFFQQLDESDKGEDTGSMHCSNLLRGLHSDWFISGNCTKAKRQVHTPKLEDWGLIEILKWFMVSDCLFRANG